MKNLKFLLTVFIITISMLSFTSCKKEDKPCNCGVITNDDIEFDVNGDMFYSLTITNDCSNNSGKYYFTYDVWLNANVGESFCVTNVTSWLPVGETTPIKVENKEVI